MDNLKDRLVSATEDMISELVLSDKKSVQVLGRLLATDVQSKILEWISEEESRPGSNPQDIVVALTKVAASLLGMLVAKHGKPGSIKSACGALGELISQSALLIAQAAEETSPNNIMKKLHEEFPGLPDDPDELPPEMRARVMRRGAELMGLSLKDIKDAASD